MTRKSRKKKEPSPTLIPVIIVLGVILILSVFLWLNLSRESRDPRVTVVEPSPIPESVQEPEPPEDERKRIPIVIVLDDVGYDLSLLDPFLKIPVPLTYAILPGLEDTGEAARILHDRGVETILHLPMENLGGTDPGPGTLRSTMADGEILALLRRNIEQVPGIRGMNNHMGSKGTQDERIVQIVLDYGRGRGLFFLDSRTTSDTKVPLVAKQLEIPILERHVFLDNERDSEAIRLALEQGLKGAESRGYAVMIGHVWSQELAEIIFELYPEILERGYEFTTLSQLLAFNILPAKP